MRRAAMFGAIAIAGCGEAARGPAVDTPPAPTVAVGVARPDDGRAGDGSGHTSDSGWRTRTEAACLAEPVAMSVARFAPRALTPAQSKRLSGFLAQDGRNCHDDDEPKPEGRLAGPFPAPPAACRYAIASIYRYANHWTAAAHWYRRVAVEHAGEHIGPYAADMYLRVLDTLATYAAPPRASCLRLLIADAERLVCIYCAEQEAEVCEQLRTARTEALGKLGTGTPPPWPACAP